MWSKKIKTKKVIRMELLKITAFLLDGRIATIDGFLPIDSIIQYGFVKKKEPLGSLNK